MVNHVVLFKMNDYNPEEKKRLTLELKNMLVGLKEKIKEVRHIEVGIHVEPVAKSYDLALISHFDTIESLDLYRNHPAHLKVVEFIAKVTRSRAAVDYEF